MPHAKPAEPGRNDSPLRAQLIELLHGGHAHATFDQVVRALPLDRAGIRVNGAPHSAWELLEHMRIAQNDILRFCQSADHVSPKWPDGYWPASPALREARDWDESARSFRDDAAEFEAMLNDAGQDLHRKIPWGEGQTLVREALLLTDHNAYHLGQLVMVRKLLGAWKE